MKIAILSNLFPPNSRGGAEIAAKNQADKFCLSRRSPEGAKGDVQGNEVIVLTLSPSDKFSVQTYFAAFSARGGPALGGALHSRHSHRDIKIYELRHRNIFNYFYIGKYSATTRFLWHIIDIFNFWLANDIKKIIKEEKPDLVICHNLKGLSLLTPSKIHNLKFKIHQVMHDVSLYTPSGLIEWKKENSFEHKGFLTKIYRFFTRRLFQYPEKVFFPSRWLMDFYTENGFFKGQEKIIEPNVAGFAPVVIPAKPALDRDRGAGIPSNINDGNRSGFLYVGQLEPHKEIMLLLDAFENVQGSTLHIIGDGSLMPEIKKRAENNPHLVVHGRISREKLPEFYARAKATIFPSLVYENAPMVIVESLSCGTPVIVSRLGGAPELIREGENGATFMPGDKDDLLEKMKKFL